MGVFYKGECPFCLLPGLVVVPNKGFYHCFYCAAHGDGERFVSDCPPVA